MNNFAFDSLCKIIFIITNNKIIPRNIRNKSIYLSIIYCNVYILFSINKLIINSFHSNNEKFC